MCGCQERVGKGIDICCICRRKSGFCIKVGVEFNIGLGKG